MGEVSGLSHLLQGVTYSFDDVALSRRNVFPVCEVRYS